MKDSSCCLFARTHPSIPPCTRLLCCRRSWAWTQLVLLTPSLPNPRLWASGFSARKPKSATAVFRLKFQESATCRSGSMPCLRRSMLPSESAGTTCLALTSEAEVHGLLALMLHCEARWSARRARDGRYIPLSEQDPKQWSRPLIEEAERHLAAAAKRSRPGRFQLEAAIQSVHAERALSGCTDWAAIGLFYRQLIQISPALGIRVGYAAAVAEAQGPEAGLAVLDSIASDDVSHYQAYWAVRAHLLQSLGKTHEASDAYDHAIGLAEDPAIREFLLRKRG